MQCPFPTYFSTQFRGYRISPAQYSGLETNDHTPLLSIAITRHCACQGIKVYVTNHCSSAQMSEIASTYVSYLCDNHDKNNVKTHKANSHEPRRNLCLLLPTNFWPYPFSHHISTKRYNSPPLYPFCTYASVSQHSGISSQWIQSASPVSPTNLSSSTSAPDVTRTPSNTTINGSTLSYTSPWQRTLENGIFV